MLALVAVLVIAAFLIKDHVRTLRSVRRVPGTNAYIMDYYVDYHMDEIRQRGMDVENIEDSCIVTLFPDLIAPLVTRAKRAYIPEHLMHVADKSHHCSTMLLHTQDGNVFFGRNFDYYHDACLILRIHNDQHCSSVAVIDLAYLNLNRPDLDETNLIQRIPLLFAPYYVMDGMNRHGVAVSNMSVDDAEPPFDAERPDIINSAAMRLVLDYAQNTDEAVQILRDFNIHFVQTPVHLLIADPTGRSVVVEFIDGQIQVTPSQERWQVCTNHIMWRKSEEENDLACYRYLAASDAADQLNGNADSDDVMRIMRSVSAEQLTMWTSVYNLTTGDFRIVHRTAIAEEYLGSLKKD